VTLLHHTIIVVIYVLFNNTVIFSAFNWIRKTLLKVSPRKTAKILHMILT
jgi:hypothetical protein